MTVDLQEHELAHHLAEAATRECYALHDFFDAWLRLDAEGPDTIDRLERALDAEFRLVGPDGQVRDRAAVIAWIAGARGSRGAAFRLAVSDCRVVWQGEAAVLLEYVETQYGFGAASKRLSTALFRQEPSAPCGVVWRHLQETWLQAPG
jgi:hypothetical protein